DDLTARAHELEHRQISRQPLSDEEKERKQFLRDYVISEVNGYSADILSAARTLQESPNKNVSEGLRENLKGLKDLGQIHAYPALEQAADNLLQIFNQLQDKQKTIGEKHIPELETLFDLFPTYIDEVINNQAEGSEEKILNQLSILHANLFDSESVSGIQSAETMEGSFQDVVTRYAVMIDEAISGDVDEERLGNLDPAFHNLLYWSDALDLQGAMETVEKVRRLMQFERFTQLDAPQRQMLSDIVKSWEAAFISTPESVWEAYNVQLDNLLEGKSVSREVPAAQPAMPLLSETPDGPADEDEAVSVDQALPAFMEVAANALASLEGRLHDDNAAILAANDIPKTMRHLADTAGAMGEADIERAFRNIYRQFAGKSEADMPEGEGFVGGLNRLLRGLRKQLQAGNAENIDEGFADLFDSAEEEDEEDEILKVFRMEALNYLEEMSAHVSTLEIQGENAQALREIGMTAHTLKGSAQMVGRGDVAELAEPLDKAIDLIENKSLAYTPELVKICRSFVTVMKERVQNHSADTAPVLASLSSYISQNVLAPTPKAAPQETPESSRVEKIGAELDPDYIYLREQDAELLQIFQNEVSNNFDDIERNLANLEKFTYDKAALKEVEQSVHEIRGAAKMLGIGEIADLTERLEQIFEKLVAQKKENMGNTIPVTRRAMHVIRELSGNFKVRKEVFNEVDNSLNALLNAPETAAADQPVSDPQMSAMIDEDLSGDFTALTSQLSAALAGESSAQSLYGEPEGQPEAAESEAEEKRTVAPQVLELYLQEAREQLEDIDYLLLKLEKDPDNLELQHHLMRCMHTLKGSSGMVYAAHVEALSHRSEDILEHNIQEKSVLSPHLFDLMGDVVKEITLILDHLARNGGESVKDFHSLIERLDGAYQGAAPAAPLPAAAPVPGVSPIDSDMSGARKDTYLRLNINKMNHLLNLAAELVISNNQFKTQLDRLKNFIPMLNGNLKTFRETEDVLNTLLQEGKQLEDVIKSNAEPGAARESMQTQVDRTQRILRNVKALQDEVSSITHNLKENSKTYDENLQKLNKLSNELLDEIMQARLVPINMLFQRFHRPIRDLARQLQKQIKLSIKGETTELDRTLIDELYEPLLHVIRNAIDHGLETVDQRTGAGKDGEGLLEIKARRDRNQVIIEVTDDGKGIDLERVKSSAIEKGLLTAGDAANMSDQELFEYLFYPGFSTAKETTMVSGRGVGLDAVKAQIEKAKGDIRMFSEPGKGTTFSIRVPISLSVIQSMLVDVTGHVYSIPLLQVEETLNVIGQDLLREDGRYYIRYREEKIPVVQLSKLLRMRGQSDQPMSTANQYPLVMVQDEGNRVALHVDKIIRREEILIKSLGPGLRRLKYISGGSIMADGQVVLVLDIPQVIQHLLKGGAEEAPETGSPEGALPLVESASPKPVRPPRQKKQVEGRKPVALIVDDSLSIRKYLSSLLMQKGYITDTARNGYEALELLNKQDFDIMVTDLEMPKLSGYELIETLRYDQRF
ncbi:MAG TPA: Hpt domain-containing protein, partial [Calditrichia bacterium]|nr:Hpt domain-containing protein [Calditrichia bacterium]